MPKSNFKPSIEGLDELRESLSGQRISKEVTLGLGQAMIGLHSALSSEVEKRYNIRNRSAGKILDPILIGKSASTKTFGKNVLVSSLEYRYKPINLAKFHDEIENPGFIGGWFYATHLTQIVKGRITPVNGHFGYGGFVPRHGKGGKGEPGTKSKPPYYAKKGFLMFERETEERLPIKEIFGPSLSEMASHIFDSRPGKVEEAINNIENFIRDRITF